MAPRWTARSKPTRVSVRATAVRSSRAAIHPTATIPTNIASLGRNSMIERSVSVSGPLTSRPGAATGMGTMPLLSGLLPSGGLLLSVAGSGAVFDRYGRRIRSPDGSNRYTRSRSTASVMASPGRGSRSGRGSRMIRSPPGSRGCSPGSYRG